MFNSNRNKENWSVAGRLPLCGGREKETLGKKQEDVGEVKRPTTEVGLENLGGNWGHLWRGVDTGEQIGVGTVYAFSSIINIFVTHGDSIKKKLHSDSLKNAAKRRHC